MIAVRVLIPDTWHFHRRNFDALFDALNALGAERHVDRTGRRWWKAHGDYRGFQRSLKPHLRSIQAVQIDDIAALEHRGINLFSCARLELLCLLTTRARWLERGEPQDEATLIRTIATDAEDRVDLELCLAAARRWIDHWFSIIAKRGPFTHALVFSGSYIYTRALQEVARQIGIAGYVMESFFTGNEFYLERSYDPLPNRSMLRSAEYRKTLALPTAVVDLAPLRAEMHQRLAASQNRNAKVNRTQLVPRLFPQGENTILIVGQVLNDFSILTSQASLRATPNIYIDAIDRILRKSSFNVIFKAHPWERKRANVRAPITRRHIEASLSRLPLALRVRVHVAETEPIGQLIGQSQYVLGLCSQALLEACAMGLKPIQCGDAFFGGLGFTSDFTDHVSAVDALVKGELSSQLNLDEYHAFEDFMTRALVVHLVSNRRGEIHKAMRMLQTDGGPWSAQDALHALRVPELHPRRSGMVTLFRNLNAGPDMVRGFLAGSRRYLRIRGKSRLDHTPRCAIFAEVDPNKMEGPAIWLASLAKALARQGWFVSVLLRKELVDERALEPLLQDPMVELIAPPLDADDQRQLSVQAAAAALVALDARRRFDAIVIRGASAALAALARRSIRRKLAIYLTDIGSKTDPDASLQARKLRAALPRAPVLLCQTVALREYLRQNLGVSAHKTTAYLLPPMVDDEIFDLGRAQTGESNVVRLIYVGKFAPLWNTVEMTALPHLLAELGMNAELHVIGSVVVDQSVPFFDQRMAEALRAPGVVWHGAMRRLHALEVAARAHVGLSWRASSMDDSMEISTKLLDFGAIGLPVICNPTEMHKEALGADYPLFASSLAEVVTAISRAASDATIWAQASRATSSLARLHKMSLIGARLSRDLRRSLIGAS